MEILEGKITAPIYRDNQKIFRVQVSYPIPSEEWLADFCRVVAERFISYLEKRSDAGAPSGGSAVLTFTVHRNDDLFLCISWDCAVYEGSVLTCYYRTSQTWHIPRRRLLPIGFFHQRGKDTYLLTDQGIVKYKNLFYPGRADGVRRSKLRDFIRCDAPIPLSEPRSADKNEEQEETAPTIS